MEGTNYSDMAFCQPNQFEEDKSLYFTMDAMIRSMNPYKDHLYKGCERCQEKLYDNNDGSYECMKCLFGPTPNYTWNINLFVLIVDSTDQAWLALSNEQAEELIGKKVDELSQIYQQDSTAYSRLMSKLLFERFTFRIGAKMIECEGRKCLRVTDFKVTPVDYVERAKWLLRVLGGATTITSQNGMGA